MCRLEIIKVYYHVTVTVHFNSLTHASPAFSTLPNSVCTLLKPIQANDAYLSMAIGNAPWPIGVTMVGIHARSGREKIFSQQIAHVLNDETQRKYIQVRHGF